jgi:glycosyltransferase involved in cell wall biosynthesis
MNVLHLISSGGMYGAERVAITLSQCLNDTGHRSTIAAFQNRHKPNLEVLRAAEAQRISTRVLQCDGRFDASAIKRLRQIVRDDNVDIVHTHNYKADLYAYVALRSSSTALMATCHTWYDNDVVVRMYGALDRFILRRFARVVAVSPSVADRLRRAGVGEEHIRTIDNGIEVGRFASGKPILREQFPNADCLVGVVARLAPEKGIRFLIEAAANVRVHCPGALFLIIGDGPEHRALEELVRNDGLSDLIVFLGKRDDMPDVYASLDVVVQPSLNEGLPMTLLEAMAAGNAIVATAVGAVPTVIEDGSNGILIPPADTPALTNAITMLVQDPERRLRLGRTARRVVEARFSDARMTCDYHAVYRELLSARMISHAAGR